MGKSETLTAGGGGINRESTLETERGGKGGRLDRDESIYRWRDEEIER